MVSAHWSTRCSRNSCPRTDNPEPIHDSTPACRSGLLGLSGVSGDVRDLEEAAASGNERAVLALDLFTSEVRRHLGGLMVELGGLDALVFTGGISKSFDLIEPSLRENLRKHSFAEPPAEVPLVVSELGAAAGVVGAANLTKI